MPQKKLYRKCYQCQGLGQIPISDGVGGIGSKVCTVCDGVGELEWGFWQDANSKVMQRCYQCGGTGSIAISDGVGGITTKICTVCNGEQNLDWGRMEV